MTGYQIALVPGAFAVMVQIAAAAVALSYTGLRSS